jgi:hypothetical protein
MAQIKAALSAKAQGYGAIINGVLNIRTVSDSRNAAAVNAAHVCGYLVVANCDDPGCDCLVRLLQSARPDIAIVPVGVEVQNG